jgi:phage terminase small subunit
MTELQKRFADRYFETLNGSQSAIWAGYSEATSRQKAYELLNEPEIEEYLTKLKAEYSEKTGITRQRVLDEYAKIAFFDIREIYDVDGGLINVKQIDDKSAGALASIKSSEEWGEDQYGNKAVVGTIKEVKVFDKIRALQDLGKHLGLFEKDNEQSKPVNAPVINIIKPKED